jgi:hypothetical protein
MGAKTVHKGHNGHNGHHGGLFSLHMKLGYK